jgi:hypothetical protein
MHHEPHRQAALVELAEHRIEQERHVVVDDLDDRDRLDVLGAHQAGAGFDADLRLAQRPYHQERPGILGERAELARLVGQQILGRRTREQSGRKTVRHVVALALDDGAHLLDEPPRRAPFLTAEKAFGHVSPAANHPVQIVAVFLIHAVASRGASL